MRLEILLAHPAVQALGRSLLHFLWQGSLLALLLRMVKTVAPTSARVRYAAASLIMLMMPVTLVVTFTRDLRQDQPVVSIAPMVSSHAHATAETSREALIAGLPTSGPKAGISGWVVCIWIGGVFLLSLRAAGGWMRAQRLKRYVLLASGELQDMMTRLKRRLSISAPVRLYTSTIVQVPTVIGWFRPYVLLPVTTITGLSESQLEAILAHELAHIRRHDYLVNLLQTAVETVLFYHPAVWWVGKQVRIERENCCDDIAVAVCGNAVEYAEALAELEQIRGRVPEPALAATGGELLGRIRRLLGQQPSEHPALPSLGTIAAAAALALLIAGAVAVAQPPERSGAAQAFEVASIKLHPEPIAFSADPAARGSRATATASTLLDLITSAYGVRYDQISGGPSWTKSDHYDIVAKAAGEGEITRDQLRQMLQTLLADRFQLKLHREMRETPVYELVVGKNGPKFKEAAADAKAGSVTHGSGTGAMHMETSRGTMEQLARQLSNTAGRPVVDKTALTAFYAYTLDWFPATRTPDADSDVASIFAAVQEQLGLKLESAKAPVDVLVIDRVEKPSEN